MIYDNFPFLSQVKVTDLVELVTTAPFLKQFKVAVAVALLPDFELEDLCTFQRVSLTEVDTVE